MSFKKIMLGVMLLVAFSAAGSFDVSTAYLSPANHLVYRLTLPGGETHDFRGYDASKPDVMNSTDGWIMRFFPDGIHARVRSPKTDKNRRRFEFERGRLICFADSEGERQFPYAAGRAAPEGVTTPLAFYEFGKDYFERAEARQMAEKWEGTRRLQFPNVNPNRSGAFYALLLLLGLATALRTKKRRWLKICAIVFTVLSALALLWTESRGAALGLFAGLVPFAIAGRFVFLRRRLFWIAVGALALIAGAWFGLVNKESLTRGFVNGKTDWGNAVRLDMWKTSPKMMFDAPGGWHADGFKSGRAYFDWYQKFEELTPAGNLMNDHLTTLAETGWIGRGAYLFAFMLLLVAALSAFVKRRDPFPLSVWLTLAVMAWFNPVYGAWTTWPVPCVALGALVMPLVKSLRVSHALRAVGISAAFAGIVVAALYFAGSKMQDAEVRVYGDGARVRLKTPNPSVWVADDEQGALGAMFVGRDIRGFYRQYPHAPSIGYTRSISNLPKTGVRRLVLSGKAAMDWLMLLSENAEARKHIPREVVMISPPFAPSEIPEGVHKCCKLRVIVGEFAARFQPEYAKPPPFVTIVPAMERYVFGWMRFAAGD